MLLTIWKLVTARPFTNPIDIQNHASLCVLAWTDMFTRWILTSPHGEQRSVRLQLYWSQPFSFMCAQLRYRVAETGNGAPAGRGFWSPHVSLSHLISIKNNEVTSCCLSPPRGADTEDALTGGLKHFAEGTGVELQVKRGCLDLWDLWALI